MQRIRRRLVVLAEHPVGASVVGGLILLAVVWVVGWIPAAWSAVASAFTSSINTPTWVAFVILGGLLAAVTYTISLRKALSRSAMAPPFHRSHNALSLPTGFILVIRSSEFIAALQALDQRPTSPRPLITYGWWYLGDGSARHFRSSGVELGTSTAHEGEPLHLASLTVPWSFGAAGAGWVYFGDEMKPPRRYEIALSKEVDIAKVEIPSLTFERYVENEEWHRSRKAS